MKATNSEAKNKVQLLNCQANLSPCSSNNFGTIEIPKRAKVSIAKKTSGEWFGCSFHFFNVSDIFLLSIVDLNMCAKIRFKNDFCNNCCRFSCDFYIFLCFLSNEVFNMPGTCSLSPLSPMLLVFCLYNLKRVSGQFL